MVVPNSCPFLRSVSPSSPKSSLGKGPFPTLVQYAFAIPVTLPISLGLIPKPEHAPALTVVDGKEINYVPYDLEDATPIYKSFPGWDKTEGVRVFDDLPDTAKSYIEALEKMIGTKMGIISTSPDRLDTIIRGA